MEIYVIDEGLIQEGMDAFVLYRNQQLVGRCGGATYENGWHRPIGRHVLIGAIMACLQTGITKRDEIIVTAARVAAVKRATAASVLDAFEGINTSRPLWSSGISGEYFAFTDGDDFSPALMIN